MARSINISKICEELELQYEGRDVIIHGLNLCNRRSEYNSILSYVVNERYIEDVKCNSSISCLVLNQKCKDIYTAGNTEKNITFILSDIPEKTFYDIHEYLIKMDFYDKFDFPAIIGNHCRVDRTAVVQDGTIIGNNVKIGAHTVIKSGTIIDDDVEIGCNTVIGSEGFQIITDGKGYPMHIPHVGKCHISSDTYIGDNTCICNSLFEGETFIGKGTKIDNLVHVGHNCLIGEGCVVTAQVILCGSSVLEDNVWLAPEAAVLNRVCIGRSSKVGLGSVVTRDVKPFTTVYGSPAKVHN